MTTTALHIIDTAQLIATLRHNTVDELWNVLTDDYFAGELIPGSRRVPLDRIGREAAAFAKDTSIVVYCSDPTCPQSKSAGEKLSALGFTNVRVYEGGLKEWKASGRGIESLDRTASAA